MSIQDAGSGLLPQDYARVFRPYLAVLSGGEHKSTSTGLSLALTYAIVRRLGGVVGVNTKPNQGCEFFLCVPLRTRFAESAEMPPLMRSQSANAANDLPAPTLSAQPSEQHAQSRRRARHVLIADDDRAGRKVLEHILQAAKPPFLCTAVDDGVKILRMLKEPQWPYDVILMDHFMPQCDGIAATRAVLLQYPEVVVIGVTGNTMAADRTRFIQAGARKVLFKPIRRQQLLSLLEDLDKLSPRTSHRRLASVSTAAAKPWIYSSTCVIKCSNKLNSTRPQRSTTRHTYKMHG